MEGARDGARGKWINSDIFAIKFTMNQIASTDFGRYGSSRYLISSSDN